MRSLLVWGLTWLYMAVVGAFLLPWVLLTGRLGAIYAASRCGVRLLLWLAGVRVQVHGPKPPTGACLFMANHQSNLDPPILLAHLPGFISFLAKRELFNVPILGSVARVGGLIPIDRRNPAGARDSIAKAAQAIRAGRPFLIFPEGTRSPDGRLLEFKKGPFYLADQAGAPVVVVIIRGTGRLMPRGSWRIRPGVVQIEYTKPLALESKDLGAWRDGMARVVRLEMEKRLVENSQNDS